ncbi:hypothetical protein [Legionella sp. 31fI33]|uniref:hypothetical protein n=1 Tax=Legionella sp. 31fI33 TaxID=2886376 RepID=UPI001E4A4899|nr:hypothetical protein [Legionella sp. 31fI33]MCC5014867.1 hypothetical protein [Legionella sp. 31fI33]
MIDSLVNFFNSPFIIIIGGISVILMIGGFLFSLYSVIKGVLPVWIRLGFGLSKSKIAIFSVNEFDDLRDMIVDSKIFKEKNINQITKNNLKKAEKHAVYLVHWQDFQEQMIEILNIKKDATALIIYAPQSEGRIEDQALLNRINQERNSVIVNFRGRLMNDILTSLITVNYEQ